MPDTEQRLNAIEARLKKIEDLAEAWAPKAEQMLASLKDSPFAKMLGIGK